MAQQPGSAWYGVPLEQRVETSEVLWGDVCQSVDPDDGKPTIIYTFGGRIEFEAPEPPFYAQPAVPVRDDALLTEGDTHLVTEARVRLSLE